MKTVRGLVVVAGLAVVCAGALALKPGEMAPDFKGMDSNGKTQTLAEYRGKYVVLEWANKGCPYRAEALQQRQHGAAAEGVDGQGRGVAERAVVGSGRARQCDAGGGE